MKKNAKSSETGKKGREGETEIDTEGKKSKVIEGNTTEKKREKKKRE